MREEIKKRNKTNSWRNKTQQDMIKRHVRSNAILCLVSVLVLADSCCLVFVFVVVFLLLLVIRFSCFFWFSCCSSSYRLCLSKMFCSVCLGFIILWVYLLL